MFHVRGIGTSCRNVSIGEIVASMPDHIGNVAVPEIVPNGAFPLVPDFPHGHSRAREVAVHQFGSGNARIEQRYLLGTGERRFTIRKNWLRDADRIALRNFLESRYGPYEAFTYDTQSGDNSGTTTCVCRFANAPLSWEMVADWARSLGVALNETATASPCYTVTQNVNRFPPSAVQTAQLSQVQEIIPLVRIRVAVRLPDHLSVRSALHRWRATLPGTASGVQRDLAVHRQRIRRGAVSFWQR
jgi:hypothetical protein